MCRNTACVLILFSCALAALCGDEAQSYADFIALNNGIWTSPNQLVSEQVMSEFDAGGSVVHESRAQVLIVPDARFLMLDDEKERLFFLGTDGGYWLLNKRMRIPLKVAGDYQTGSFEIQEILRINFESDYKLTEHREGTTFLERAGKRVVYPFASVEELSAADGRRFRLLLYDRNRRPVRELVYHSAVVDGYSCFARTDVRDLVFETSAANRLEILSVKPIRMPSTLFSAARMRELAIYAEQRWGS